METEFTPYLSLAEGMLIGLASALLMHFRGRVFGATGILAGFMLPESSSDWAWRAALVAGMVSGPLAVLLISGEMPAVQVPVSTTTLLIGGVIVGVGVTYGSGCTSGHGVCGMARFSRRSIVATATFMLATFATVYVVRHLVPGGLL